jgi:LysR family transcriptional regulator, benzoate and cis,cis-muconate-responsive activator of ben and cat genes
MDLHQMRQFLVVAEEKNLSRAATRLNISQPPLTVSIKKLEEQLKIKLLLRTNRGVTLTSAGELFYEDCRRIISEVNYSVEKLKHYELGLTGQLRIGFSVPMVFLFLPKIIAAFRRKYPAINIDLTARELDLQINRLNQKEVDLCMGIYTEPDAVYQTLKLAGNNLVALLPEGHPLAKKEKISIKELAKEPLIFSSGQALPNLQSSIFSFCHNKGRFEPKVDRMVEDLPTLFALVGAGVGASIMMSFAVKLPFPMVKVVPFHEKSPIIYSGLTWVKAQETPAIRGFNKLAKEVVIQELGASAQWIA